MAFPPKLCRREVGRVFLAGKKMSERSELFFPEEKHAPPPSPPPQPEGWEPKPNSSRSLTQSQIFPMLSESKNSPQQDEFNARHPAHHESHGPHRPWRPGKA